MDKNGRSSRKSSEEGSVVGESGYVMDIRVVVDGIWVIGWGDCGRIGKDASW